MRSKVILVILALVSSGVNFCPASFCAIHCVWSAQIGSAHHLQMASRPGRAIGNNPADDERQKADCAGCISEPGISIRSAADCSSSARVDALRESSFSLHAPRTAAAIDLTQRCTRASFSTGDGKRSALRADSPPSKSSALAPLSLRV